MQPRSRSLSTPRSADARRIPPVRQPFGLAEAAPQLKPDPLLYAVSLMILTNVWRLQDLFSVLSILKLNLTATALTVALLAIDRSPARHLSKLRTPIVLCMLLVFGLAILGVPMSLWPRRSATFVVRDFFPNLLLMIVVAASIRGMRDLYWLAMVNLVGACIFSLFVHLKFEVGPSGRLNNLVYYDANDLALVLVCTIPFAILFFVRQRWQYRLLALASLLLLVATVAQTGSRGGFLGFVGVLLYVLLGYRAIQRRIRLLATASVFGLLMILASGAYWETVRTLRNPTQDYNWAGASPEGRMEVWRRGVRYVAGDPFLGVGLANFSLAEGMLSEVNRARIERGAGFKWSVAHNTFLEIAVELGLIAFALFLAALISAFRTLHRIRGAHPLEDSTILWRVAFACTLSASLVGFLISGFFVSAGHFSYLYVLLGLSMGLAKIDRGSRPQRVAWSGRRSPGLALGHRAVASDTFASLADRVRRSSTRPRSGRTGRLQQGG
jgi:O-antigen ligase